jgi:hypothetical protein
MSPNAARTTRAYNLLELDDGQFEDIVYDLAWRMNVNWDVLYPVGRAGSDGGRDILGRQRFRRSLREWRFQAKRWARMGPSETRKVAREGVPDPEAPPYKVVLATSARLSTRAIAAFEAECVALGITENDVWTRDTINAKLRLPQNRDLAAFYFGEGHAIDGTMRLPLGMVVNAGRDLPLSGRTEVLAALSDRRDVVLMGMPGTGKTRVAMELPGVRFLNHEADVDAIAESIRRHRPPVVCIDDAGFDLQRLQSLLELRRAGHRFSIAAVTWPSEGEAVRRWLPDAETIEVGALPRADVDAIVVAMGITNPLLRRDILDQAGGRPGWAIALSDLAIRGRTIDVISGQGIVDQVEPYVRRAGGTVEALGFLAVIAALDTVDSSDWSRLDASLGINALTRQRLLQEAAAAGVLDPVGQGGLRVAPEALRLALVAHWFYHQRLVPWPLIQLATDWPDRRLALFVAALTVAEYGSDAARGDVDRLLLDLSDLPEPALARFVALDEASAARAIATTADHPAFRRNQVVTTAARRFLVPDAVRALLDSAIGDERREASHPEHPVRVLGEIGTQITPLGTTTFEARRPLMEIATEWYDEEPSEERGRVWAKLSVHLLSPRVAGNYADPGSPMTIHIQAGTESVERLQEIRNAMWPLAAARLARLDGVAITSLVDLVDEWVRLARGFEGPLGSGTPPEPAQAIAREFAPELAASLEAASHNHPGPLMRLRRTLELLGGPGRPRVDGEYRLLSLEVWRARRRLPGLIDRVIRRLADCWVGEEPARVMMRVASHSRSARDAGTYLPNAYPVMQALAARVADPEPWIDAGIGAGLNYELTALFEAAVRETTTVPSWFDLALDADLRPTAVSAALAPGASAVVAARALERLDQGDLLQVEAAILERSRAGHDQVSRDLLRHPINAVRGVASLWFGIRDGDHARALPDGWYEDWSNAFAVAPLASPRGGGDNYRLSEQIRVLVERDPDLVERWLVALLESNFADAVLRLPRRAENVLDGLPRGNRDRIMRTFADEPLADRLLALLIDSDSEWVQTLVRDGVVDTDSVLVALSNDGRDSVARIPKLIAMAPALLDLEVSADAVASRALFGTWAGNESTHYEQIRLAFERADVGEDRHRQAVRDAGLRIFGQARDRAALEEERRAITGEL